MSMSTQSLEQLLADAELIHSEHDIQQALQHMAVKITQILSQKRPLVLCVMTGAVVFAGQLLPKLSFSMDFDYLHVTRYGNALQGGEILWLVEPKENIKGRVVLVLDDILDHGNTLMAIRDKILERGATAFYSAVLVEKQGDFSKAIQADFVGLTVPDRYVFGFGMDIHGAWRNLPAIYALVENKKNK